MITEPQPNSAYTTANAYESWEPHDGVYDSKHNCYHNVTLDDIEHFARIVAYKVASNLKNGYKMDPYTDPLTYVDCKDYPCLKIENR